MGNGRVGREGAELAVGWLRFGCRRAGCGAGGGGAGSILGNQIVMHGEAVSESLTINPPRRRAAKQ